MVGIAVVVYRLPARAIDKVQGEGDKVRSTEVDAPGMQRLNMHDRRVTCRAPMHLEAAEGEVARR